jgi:hypothetical protein
MDYFSKTVCYAASLPLEPKRTRYILGLTSPYRKHTVLNGQAVGVPKVALIFAAA